ncbi:hypothetical protein RBB78_17065 [Tunturiibacter empetritectus]|uniref:hypothetical protein n=1 Tax=Tunturiibacter empetritectus TaxID=3069691 RepID=UPI003D9BC395
MRGRSQAGLLPVAEIHAAPEGAGTTEDWMPGARRSEVRRVLPSRERRRRVW